MNVRIILKQYISCVGKTQTFGFNPLNAKLNPICDLLALLGAHPILHVSRIRVKQDGARITTRL
jgi:hypothetical protein